MSDNMCEHGGLDGNCLRCKDAAIARLTAENAARRAELADLKDGLTAAHMDGFASGKAEATEMLRKREGQLEELRAEVKAYREVEDSLQKEIKRLKPRRVQQIIRKLRLAGHNIGSSTTDPMGYYITSEQDENADMARKLRARGIKVLMVAARFSKRSLRMEFDQGMIEQETE